MKRWFWLILVAGNAAAQQPQAMQEDVRVERHGDGRGMAETPEPLMAGMIGPHGHMGVLNVTGKPFSATETRHTVQMLANGAKIETSDSNLIFRDHQGRTRVEQKTLVVLMDPVARFVAILDRANKTYRKNPIPSDAVRGSSGRVMVLMDSGPQGKGAPQLTTVALKDEEVNGVMASGTRQTRTIPPGAIGNDRPLEVVDERWFSPGLQVLVKSVSSDPRFGQTTYQLINIVRGVQEPNLFQVPSDYTVENRPNLPGR
jgi:hypothetical protein